MTKRRIDSDEERDIKYGRRIANAAAESACARQILSTLVRRAYRRPSTPASSM